MDDYLTIAIAIVSLLVGYLFSVWQDWFRPWIRLVRVSDKNIPNDDVDLPIEIFELSKKSRLAHHREHKANLGSLKNFVEKNGTIIDQYHDGKIIIDTIIEDLRNSRSDKDTIKIISKFLDNDAIRDELLVEIDMNIIAIPEVDSTKSPKLQCYFDDKEDGTFAIDFDECVRYIGDDLSRHQVSKEKIEKFVQILVTLDKDKIIEIFTKFIPEWYTQYEINPKILEGLKKLLRENSSWGIEFYISNYGNKPFILIPEETQLILKSSKHKIPPFEVTLLKNIKEDDVTSWIEVDTDLLIPQGKSKLLKIVTKQSQKNMPDGEVIRAIYSTGESEIFAKFSIIEPNFSLKQIRKSNSIKFSNTD